MHQTVAAHPRLTSQRLAEIVEMAHAQRAVARRSRASAREYRVHAERNYQTALTRGEAVVCVWPLSGIEHALE